MKNKCYNVILGLSKYAKGIEIFTQAYLANSEANALAMAMQSEFVSSKLLDGYAINSKSVGLFHETVAPINSDSECIVIREFSGEPRQLHIDLRNNYTESYKRDLQAFLLKYYPNLQPIYPEFLS
jgi:hypothetical protein